MLWSMFDLIAADRPSIQGLYNVPFIRDAPTDLDELLIGEFENI
jgi:hypothetical protein